MPYKDGSGPICHAEAGIQPDMSGRGQYLGRPLQTWRDMSVRGRYLARPVHIWIDMSGRGPYLAITGQISSDIPYTDMDRYVLQGGTQPYQDRYAQQRPLPSQTSTDLDIFLRQRLVSSHSRLNHDRSVPCGAGCQLYQYRSGYICPDLFRYGQVPTPIGHIFSVLSRSGYVSAQEQVASQISTGIYVLIYLGTGSYQAYLSRGYQPLTDASVLMGPSMVRQQTYLSRSLLECLNSKYLQDL